MTTEEIFEQRSALLDRIQDYEDELERLVQTREKLRARIKYLRRRLYADQQKVELLNDILESTGIDRA